MDLVEFLRARLDEDEEVARRVAEKKPDAGVLMLLPQFSADRVLAEVEAKRTIIDLHYKPGGWYGGRSDVDPSCTGSEDTFEARPEECDTLRSLALPYADHEDFDPAWRV